MNSKTLKKLESHIININTIITPLSHVSDLEASHGESFRRRKTKATAKFRVRMNLRVSLSYQISLVIES